MAGTHQIWKYEIPQNSDTGVHKIENFAGSGAESTTNTTTNRKKAAFAQPSGISIVEISGNPKNENSDKISDSVAIHLTDGSSAKTPVIIVADSESSKIRGVFISEEKTVSFAGGNDLADDLKAYGDIDGNILKEKDKRGKKKKGKKGEGEAI